MTSTLTVTSTRVPPSALTLPQAAEALKAVDKLIADYVKQKDNEIYEDWRQSNFFRMFPRQDFKSDTVIKPWQEYAIQLKRRIDAGDLVKKIDELQEALKKERASHAKEKELAAYKKSSPYIDSLY